MKNRSFLILIGVCALVVGYAAYDYWSEQRDSQQKAEQAILLKLGKDQITEVRLTRGDEIIALQRTPEGWQLTEPLNEVGDQTAIVDFVEGTTLEKSTDVAKEGSGINWAVFGLEKPAAKLSFKDNAGQTVEFMISEKKNFAGDYYLRKTGEEKVYVVSSTWNTRAQKKAIDFRDKRVLKKEPATFQEISYKIDSHMLFKVKKQGAEWSLIEGPKGSSTWILEAGRVNEIMSSLNVLLAQEILNSPTGKDMNDRSLKVPLVEISLQPNSGIPWKASFYQNSKSETYVLTSEPERLLKINSSDFIKYKTKTIDDLRDRHLAFKIDRDKAHTLDLTTSAGLAHFTSVDAAGWKVEKEDPELETKAESVPVLVSGLKNLMVSDFSPPNQVNPWAEMFAVRINDGSGKPVYSLEVLGSYSKGKDKMLKLKSSMQETAFGIEESKFLTLPLKDILRSKNKAH